MLDFQMPSWDAEALGHLNEAGVAARAAPMSPNRDGSPGPTPNLITPVAPMEPAEQQESVPDSPEAL